MRHPDMLEDLPAYEASAADRDRSEKPVWQQDQRARFAARLAPDGAVGHSRRVLELGAGTGKDSAYFVRAGHTVIATDATPAMVEHCRAKGLDARVMDMTTFDLPPESFDAAYAMNSLLHIPNADLPAVLRRIREVLVPGELFFLGVYGGDGSEGVWVQDWHRPPRFFSLRTDAQLVSYVEACFEVVDFHVIELDGDRPWFQSCTLRRPDS